MARTAESWSRSIRYHAPGSMTSLLPYTPDRDVYRLLGVPATATTEEIQAACRRLARTFHPDRNPSRRATQEMQIVNVVRRVMTDPALRARYDRERHRFHAARARRAAERSVVLAAAAVSASSSSSGSVRPMAAGWRPSTPMTTGSRSLALERYWRAIRAGLRATIASLAPPRCRTCRIVISPEDSYCAACGTPRLTGG